MERQPEEALHCNKTYWNFRASGLALIACTLVTLAGCRNEPPSAVVRTLEQYGAKNVRTSSPESIAQWLAKHDDALRKTEELCKAIRPNAPANWGNLTEGRVCQAAAQVTFFHFIPREGDHRTFGAGTK